jgi:hypothetical protein
MTVKKVKRARISRIHLFITIMAAVATWFWGFGILIGLGGVVVHEAFGTSPMSPTVVIPGIIGCTWLSLLAVFHFGRGIR